MPVRQMPNGQPQLNVHNVVLHTGRQSVKPLPKSCQPVRSCLPLASWQLAVSLTQSSAPYHHCNTPVSQPPQSTPTNNNQRQRSGRLSITTVVWPGNTTTPITEQFQHCRRLAITTVRPQLNNVHNNGSYPAARSSGPLSVCCRQRPARRAGNSVPPTVRSRHRVVTGRLSIESLVGSTAPPSL